MDNNIVLQLGERGWTERAIHLACALARNLGGRVILLDMRAVSHPSLLGSPDDDTFPTAAQYQTLCACADTCEDYGVDYALQPMQYLSQPSALQQAVELLQARALFVPAPAGAFGWLNRWRAWRLERNLKGTNCRLFLIGSTPQAIDWTSAAPPAQPAAEPHPAAGSLTPG